MKNLLVFAAPAAAGELSSPQTTALAGATFLAFCMCASGVYMLNDARDVEHDRLHPKKRHRPIAAGDISARTAVLVGLALLVAGGAAAVFIEPGLAVVLLVYLTTTTAYTYRLKRVPVIEFVLVSVGFVLRALAGAVAVDLPVSAWFIIVTSFGSLFVVAGKRHGEYVHLGESRGHTREALALYSLDYLRFVWMLSAAVAVAAYCLWAFESVTATAGNSIPWHQLSIAPFVVALFRYAYLIDAGDAGAPEEVFYRDGTMQALVAIWAGVYSAAVYVG